MKQLSFQTMEPNSPSKRTISKPSGLKPSKLKKGDKLILDMLSGPETVAIFQARVFTGQPAKAVNILYFPDLAKKFEDEKYGYCHMSDFQLRTRCKLQK